jgi:hypothetical protein
MAQSPARWMPTRILVDRTLWFDPFGKNVEWIGRHLHGS